MDNLNTETKPIPLILDGKYILKEKIGSGSFGQIYTAICKQTGVVLAAKLENKTSNIVMTLAKEAKVLQEMNGEQGFPIVYSYGKDVDYNYMTLNLLGHDLEKLFKICHYKFSLKTILMIADQMLTRIEALHKKNYLHRDIKPENFCLTKDPMGELNLIDFGLSRAYVDSNGKHIPCVEKKGLVGTARYASINNHHGLEQSRRDDLESIGYVLIYLMKGKLPWQNLSAKNKQDKYERIAHVKTTTPVEVLCQDLPMELSSYINYVKNLEFTQVPDYQYLKSLFHDLANKSGFEYDYEYDWVQRKEGRMSMFHMDSRQKYNQPIKVFASSKKDHLQVANEFLQPKKTEGNIPRNSLYSKIRELKETEFSYNQMAITKEGKSTEVSKLFDAHNPGTKNKNLTKGNTIALCARKVSPVISNDTPEEYDSDNSQHSSKALNLRKTMFEEDEEIPLEITFHTSPTEKIKETRPLEARTKNSYYTGGMNYLQPGTARTDVRKRTFIRTYSVRNTELMKEKMPKEIYPTGITLEGTINQLQKETSGIKEENLNESSICELSEMSKMHTKVSQKTFIVQSRPF